MSSRYNVFAVVLLCVVASKNSSAAGQKNSPDSMIRAITPPQLAQQKGAAFIPRVVNIPSGCFQMGSPETELGRGADESLHRVCVKGFKLAKNELTREEFGAFVSATHFVTDAERNTEESGCWSYDKTAVRPWDWWGGLNWKQPLRGVEALANDPVSCVSLRDVMAYIAWLNKATDQHYRLPTEAEWEYAARGGTSTARYWGSNPDIACRYSNVADRTTLGKSQWSEQHHCEDGYFFSADVSHFRANKFDLYHTLGNVWEWTCSRYEDKYAGVEAVCGTIKQNSDELIVIRGGGWNADPARVRAASRNWGTAWTRQANLGFRLIRER